MDEDEPEKGAGYHVGSASLGEEDNLASLGYWDIAPCKSGEADTGDPSAANILVGEPIHKACKARTADVDDRIATAFKLRVISIAIIRHFPDPTGDVL